VKLKGYRIELDEVASALLKHPRVRSAAAIVKDKSILIGFFVPSDINRDEIRDIISDNLPSYMVPSVLHGLDSMPENVNGKVNIFYLCARVLTFNNLFNHKRLIKKLSKRLILPLILKLLMIKTK
jgi:acyl-coenzyme A synthetase/AMP-(fatty) acid ligase